MALRVRCIWRRLAYCAACLFWRHGRPREMLQRGRPIVRHFGRAELLHFRWFNDWFEKGEIRVANIPLPDQSMNRNWCRLPFWHVLIPDSDDDAGKSRRTLCMGVVQVPADLVRVDVRIESDVFEFLVEHDPLSWNYAHSELRVFQNGRRISADEAKQREKSDRAWAKVWTRAKKQFRGELQNLVRDQQMKEILHSEVRTGQHDK